MTQWLIAEYCPGPFYMGWHLYLRDNNLVHQPNKDGTWGWLRWRGKCDGKHPAHNIFSKLDIEIHGDGTCDGDGIAEFARLFRFPEKLQYEDQDKPHKRGGVEVVRNEKGELVLATQ